MEGREIAAELYRALRHLTWATVLLYGVVIVMILTLAWRASARQDDLDAEVKRNTLVLCAFRADIEDLVAGGLKFDATLASLGSLDCPDEVAWYDPGATP